MVNVPAVLSQNPGFFNLKLQERGSLLECKDCFTKTRKTNIDKDTIHYKSKREKEKKYCKR